MLTSLKRQWRSLRRSRPGQRFEDRHNRIKKSADQNRLGARLLRWGVALVSLVIGVILTIAPGPAFVFYAIAAGMLASESLRLARWMDKLEVWIRAGLKWARKKFLKLPLPGKIAVGFTGALVASAGVWLTYRTFMA